MNPPVSSVLPTQYGYQTKNPLADLYVSQDVQKTAQNIFGNQPSQSPTAMTLFGDSMKNLRDAALQTVKWEGRYDKDGNLEVYQLPKGDGGGTAEVAGINNGNHPEAFKELASMDPSKRQDYAADYILKQNESYANQFPEGMRGFILDMAHNRGQGGTTKYLQKYLNSKGAGLVEDGGLGPKTLAAMKGQSDVDLMKGMSLQQKAFEEELAKKNPARNELMDGLMNRIVNRLRVYSGQSLG